MRYSKYHLCLQVTYFYFNKIKGKIEIKKERGIYCTIDSVKDVANGIIDLILKSKDEYIYKMNVPLGA